MKIALTILTESPLRKTGLTSLFHEFLSRGLTKSVCYRFSRERFCDGFARTLRRSAHYERLQPAWRDDVLT